MYLPSAKPRPPVPAQLPPPPRHFASRSRELAELTELVDDQRPSLVVLSGAGGVGKTTLALRWLHDVRARFPDGQLYVDLGAFAPTGPVEPAEVLAWFLVALGVPAEQVPIGLAQRQALFRSLTTERSIVILLDNAVSAAQVRPLLPNASRSAAVVTSRWRLTGLAMDGASIVEVDPMDPAASMEMLRQVVGNRRLDAEHEAAQRLASLCGGLPIALSVVGARLSARPRRLLSTEVGDLSGRDRLANLAIRDESSVEGIFDVSYARLSPAQARIYRLCALHPGAEFDLDVAVAVVAGPADDVAGAFDALVEANLLMETADRRFRYHDLLRLHARHLAEQIDGPAACAEVVVRTVEWYLDMTAAAEMTLRPSRRRVGPRFRPVSGRPVLFATVADALGWLESERDNLTAAVRAAAGQDRPDLVWQFCEAMWGFFLHTRHYTTWLALHEQGVSAAVHVGDRLAEAQLRFQVAFALRSLGQHAEAMEQSTLSLRLAEQEQDGYATAVALLELANSLQETGSLTAALANLVRAEEIHEAAGNTRAVALCRRRVGEVLAELGRVRDAIEQLTSAAAVMAAVGDRTGQARALRSVGVVLLRAGRPVDALAPLEEALSLAEDVGTPYYLAEVVAVLGEVAEQRGDLATAREQYARAANLYAEMDEPKAKELRSRLARLARAPSDGADDVED
ncbi:tetratricopeptide repeat protein [Solihabitans fulvus]|uniref:Tetratricopeptide repeat protein n=1 Tax=Solihabitans fulvus TaxID=1892852 RepID=A0A5B2WZQ3_9PSEU|nr:tetratricopeptide repeat protein [Solihabitans fulvus]